jgi:hypothetical protein
MVDRLVAQTLRLVPALVSAFAMVYPSASAGQIISGTVREKSSQAGVGDAVVILFDADKKLRSAVRSTPQGTYAITAPSPGLYSLSVQKSGLTTINTEIFRLVGTSSIVRDFEAMISPPTLATMTVTGKPVVNSAGPNSHKYDQFLLRRNLGIGTFLTREQIEAKPATQTPQLFQNIPGLKVTQNGTQWLIHSQRCASKLEGGGRDASMDEDDPALFPILFIDGFRVKGLGTLNDLNPSDIEGIEVYQGAAQLPAEAKGNACAAIFVWLRQLH